MQDADRIESEGTSDSYLFAYLFLTFLFIYLLIKDTVK